VGHRLLDSFYRQFGAKAEQSIGGIIG